MTRRPPARHATLQPDPNRDRLMDAVRLWRAVLQPRFVLLFSRYELGFVGARLALFHGRLGPIW